MASPSVGEPLTLTAWLNSTRISISSPRLKVSPSAGAVINVAPKTVGARVMPPFALWDAELAMAWTPSGRIALRPPESRIVAAPPTDSAPASTLMPSVSTSDA